jgi:mono/diheme cytochrome c family protein
MRERWARALAMATGVMVLLLSAAFAAVMNAPAEDPATAPAAVVSEPDPQQLAKGRAVFDENHCARCHSVAGKGSPRSPLDGVGSRLSRAELHIWVTGAESVREELSPRAITAKQRYAELADEPMAALLDYLSSLK